jgi:hypothetical protein
MSASSIAVLLIPPLVTEILVFFLTLSSATLVWIRVWAWMKKRQAAKDKVISDQLTLLATGQTTIYEKLELMDKLRDDANRVNDETHIRIASTLESSEKVTKAYRDRLEKSLDKVESDVNLCVVATGTALDGILQLGNCTGGKVNGNVLRLHQKLKNRIEDGVNSAIST